MLKLATIYRYSRKLGKFLEISFYITYNHPLMQTHFTLPMIGAQLTGLSAVVGKQESICENRLS